METVNMSGSAQRTGNKSLQTPMEPKSDINLRKVYDDSVKQKPKSEPQSFFQTLIGMEKRTLESEQNSERAKMTVSFMKNENEKLKYLQKCEKFDSFEEILTGSYSKNQLEICDNVTTYYRSLKNLCSNKKNFQQPQGRSSRVIMHNDGEINPERMIEIIQKELKTLTDMTPSVIMLATTLSETLSHYKECPSCSEKISSSLPWILNRIENLIEYVTTKRRGIYHRSKDYSCLKLAISGSAVKEPEGVKDSVSSEFKSDLPSEKSKRQIQISEKVDAIDIAEGRPGLHIALKFKPEIKKKRFFEQADHRFLENFCKSFPIVHLRESNSYSIIQIIKPSPKPQIFWDKRKIVLSPKELFYAYHQVFASPSTTLNSILVVIPVIRIRSIEKTKRTSYFKSIKSSEERNLQTKKNLFTVFTPHNKKRSELKAVRNNCSQTQNPDEKKFFAKRLLANDLEIVKDLLKQVEEENMQIHKMKELESEVKELKDLILDVHKNQMELGKVVIEEGVYSELIMNLTDPNMLEEENQIVKKLTEVEDLGKKNSTENLQTTVEYVKQKCTVKNRMIMTLIKCLRSNLYKKWWEEIINPTFDESKSTEKFNLEKVTELLRQTSLILVQDKKDTKESLEESRSEEQNSEEEPNMKELMEENFPKIPSHQNKKLVKTKGCMQLSNFEEFLNCRTRMKILAFPITNLPENMNSLIRKLESQISVLSMENERLWHEVHELRDLLKGSMKRFPEKRLSSVDSGYILSDKMKTSGKIINLTIQITSEKDFRNLNDSPYLKTIKNVETLNEVSKSSPVVKYSATESVTDENDPNYEKTSQNQNLSDLSDECEFRSKLAERRSENNSNYLNDLPLSFFCDNGQESERLRTVFREKNFIKEQKRSTQKVTMSTPHSPNNDIRQNLKPILRVPSKHMIPEVVGGHQAGPSHRPADIRYLQQSRSQTELIENQNLGIFAAMANERELQTIPEHDHTNFNCSLNHSKDVSQAIRYLRTKVRSIHKDVAVLKSKNDRIDKMLDKLIDDTLDNNKNLDEVGNDLYNLKNRLG